MLHEGQQVDLTIEKPAAGGWMIARHHGQIVLVRGAIPGERVLAWVERAEKRLAYAVTREVIEASPDRRAATSDPLCGGALYSHISYERQLAVKADVVKDAFARVGRCPLGQPVEVSGSPEFGYRMRARCHVHSGRAGFYREGTHQLCDPASTGQLQPASVDALSVIAEAAEGLAKGALTSITITENIQGDQRAAHLETAGGTLDMAGLEAIAAASAVGGVSARARDGRLLRAGEPSVSDPLDAVTSGRASVGALRRHAESFFQGNRFLLAALVTAVCDAVPSDGDVLDLYAGVGLFSVSLAAAGRPGVTAVEGDRASGEDLQRNAAPFRNGLSTWLGRVEDYLRGKSAGKDETVIVDPPRTGISKAALEAIVQYAPRGLIYVSCDPPTLARDARGLLDSGYRLRAIRGFDLFPNTPHVETLASFER